MNDVQAAVRDRLSEPPEAAVKAYRTIVADPPWHYEQFMPSYTPSTGREARLPKPYQSMEVDAIAALPVAALAATDARLFLWTTNKYLPDAFEIVAEWGFRYQQTITWHKTGRVPPFGGWVAPLHSEFLLIAAVGNPERSRCWHSSVIASPRLDHSVKPELFLDAIEATCPAPRLEMFARRNRLGWDTWGNESLQHVEMGAA